MTGSFLLLLLFVQPQCGSLKRKVNLRRQQVCGMEGFLRRKQRAFFKALPPRCGVRAGPAVGKEEA